MRSNLQWQELCFHYLLWIVSNLYKFPTSFQSILTTMHWAAVLHKRVIMNYKACIQGLQGGGGGGQTSDLYLTLQGEQPSQQPVFVMVGNSSRRQTVRFKSLLHVCTRDVWRHTAVHRTDYTKASGSLLGKKHFSCVFWKIRRSCAYCSGHMDQQTYDAFFPCLAAGSRRSKIKFILEIAPFFFTLSLRVPVILL